MLSLMMNLMLMLKMSLFIVNEFVADIFVDVHFDVEVNIRVPKSIICLAGDCLHQRNLLSTGRSHRFGNNNVIHNEKNHVLSVLKNEMFTAMVSYVKKKKLTHIRFEKAFGSKSSRLSNASGAINCENCAK